MDKFQRDALWKDACFQAEVAGVDPSDPVFLKHARQAPEGLSFYDQVTQAIVRTMAEHEVAQRRQDTAETHLTTISEALDSARDVVR